MSLDDYRRKRDFSRTPEPAGEGNAAAPGRRYCIQMHQARRLHYDFRLEFDGVLKSWAVPKGPSLDPQDKRLAVETEDHPVEYADFEGTIPGGEYGAGAVLLWDSGEWEPVEDFAKGLREGRLKFALHGQKLEGRWTLIRMKGDHGEESQNWLLIKERDEHVRSHAEYDIVAARPESVRSGRALKDIKTPAARTTPAPAPAKVDWSARVSTIAGAKRGTVPARWQPQLPSLTTVSPNGRQWIHEIKFDGYRLQCRLEDGKAKLITRRQQDWTARFPELAQAFEQLPTASAFLDGEISAQMPNGVCNFHELLAALSGRQTGRIVFFAFDLLALDGWDLRGCALESRKSLLRELLAAGPPCQRLQCVDHFEGDGPEFARQCCRMGLEGIVSKRRDRPASAGRGTDWLKFKCVLRDEFVIGGYTNPTGARKGLGAVLVGYYQPSGEFMFAGKVGTGFSESALADVHSRLLQIARDHSPFANLPDRAAERGTHWVEPQLVAQIEYRNWTADGLLWHPAFQGLREDKDPREVFREEALRVGDERRGKRRGNEASESAPVSTVGPPVDAPADRSGDRTSGQTAESSVAPPPRPSPARGEGERVTSAPAGGGADARLVGLQLSHPDRVLYAEQGITKLGLAAFYYEIADWILPHVVDRPLTLVRCMQGKQERLFFQKHGAAGQPPDIQRFVTDGDDGVDYLYIRDLRGLLSLVQWGVLEIHVQNARLDDLAHPDRVILDLDPAPDVPWPRVIDAARLIRERLVTLGLESFVKTSGGKGLHIVVPLQRRQDWPQAVGFADRFAKKLAAEFPRDFVATSSKAARTGRIYLDHLRNGPQSSTVAPYSPRARGGAPVSVPIAWDELTPQLHPDQFHISDLPGRLKALARDPWEGFFAVRQSLTAKVLRSLG